MERKIGEIFEYNGEWYQCVPETNVCDGCVFKDKECKEIKRIRGECQRASRKYDGVIFKKLEKVGEPYTDYCPSGRVIYFQRYKCYQTPAISKETIIHWADDISVSIELKQNKEDMEEKKSNLKPFDLEAAKAGKPVCTRDGRKARIICFDAKGMHQPIIALITQDNGIEYIETYYSNGHFNDDSNSQSDNDLMMLPEKKEGWVNVYRDCDGANITKDDNIYSSKEAAIASAQIIDGNSYVATTKINWEE